MKKITLKFKRTLLFALSLALLQTLGFGQTNQTIDLITIKIVCEGNSETEAITEGLRSALNQTSVVFISSNITVINDQITNDQVSMINNGSINKYTILDKYIDEKGHVKLNLEVSISLNKLESFVKSTGGETELKGGLFAANIKLMELNEKAEQKAVSDLIIICKEILKNSFDYNIKNGEPTNNNGIWQIPLEITIAKNSNYLNFTSFFYKTLKNISMGQEEINKYAQLKKQIFSIGLFDNTNLSNSTPQILFYENSFNEANLKSLLKSFNLNYFVKYYQRSDINSDDTLSYLSNTHAGAEKFKSNFISLYRSLQNNINYMPNDYKVLNRFYTSNPSGNYNSVFFRSENSYLEIERFIESIESNIKDIKINNGIDSIDLRETYLDDNYANKNQRKFGYHSESSNFLIALSHDNGHLSFYHKYLNGYRKESYQNNGISSLSFDEYTRLVGNGTFQGDKVLLRNRVLEDKIILFNRNVKGFGVTTLGLEATAGEFQYFDFVFGNYILYLKSFQNFYYYDFVKSSFPVQLTFIGDENNHVFKIGVYNYLSTEEIAKVSKYIIVK